MKARIFMFTALFWLYIFIAWISQSHRATTVWWCREILLGRSGLVVMMLRPRNHAWTQSHHLMKAFLEAMLLYKHQLLYGTHLYMYYDLVSQIVQPSWFGFRTHQMHLCDGVRPPQRVSWIWHQTIWWWGCSNAGTLGNMEYLFSAIALWPTLNQSDSTWKGSINKSNRTV